jgi:sialic acid synthase SpsE
VILSTGMANLGNIQFALEVLEKPGTLKSITILQCTTAYPCPDHEVHLASMNMIKSSFGYPVGFSDHSTGITASVCAVALGATVIEKHFTYDRNAKGPDHQASLSPKELLKYVNEVRKVDILMGSMRKTVRDVELPNINVVQKKLFVRKAVSKGTKINLENIMCLKSNDGLPANWLFHILGKPLKNDYVAGQKISWDEMDEF